MLLGDGGGWLAAGLRELRFLVGFGGVGLLATATHIGSATLLVAAFGFDPKWAAVLGVTASAAVSYFGHIHVTFRIDADHGDFLPKFILSAVVAYILSYVVTYLLNDVLGIAYFPSFLVLGVVIPGTNYLMFRLWVFRFGVAAKYHKGDNPND